MSEKNSFWKGVKEGAKQGAMMTAVVAGGIAGGLPGLAVGYLVCANSNTLEKGFKAALTSWRRQSGHSLSLKAQMLRFRNAVSYGAATARENRREMSHKRSMSLNPYYKESYNKALKEGRKMKFSEKLKAKLKFYAWLGRGLIAEQLKGPTPSIQPSNINLQNRQNGGR